MCRLNAVRTPISARTVSLQVCLLPAFLHGAKNRVEVVLIVVFDTALLLDIRVILILVIVGVESVLEPGPQPLDDADVLDPVLLP